MKRQVSKYNVLITTMLTFFLLAISSCQNESRKDCIIDMEKAMDVSSSTTISLSSLIESYRIIQLETSSDCLVGRIDKIVKVNSTIFVKTSGAELLQFDGKGKYIKKIGAKGKGPGEFLEISDFAVNEDASIVAISSYKDILFYSVDDGKFIKKQSLSYYVSSLCFLPNEELLAQVTQASFLIAHMDTEGNIINSFGSMSRALELDQPFEFLRLDGSHFIYRVGETTDFYSYNFGEKYVTRSKIFLGKKALKERELHAELVAAGPDGYRVIGDFLRNHYSIKYMKILGSNILVSYLFEGNSRLLLYNRDKNIKRDIVFRPEESSNLIDDVLFLSSEVLLNMNRANSDDNSVLIHLYPEVIKEYLKDQKSNTIVQSRSFERIYELYNSLKIEDNPIIIEYYFKEI